VANAAASVCCWSCAGGRQAGAGGAGKTGLAEGTGPGAGMGSWGWVVVGGSPCDTKRAWGQQGDGDRGGVKIRTSYRGLVQEDSRGVGKDHAAWESVNRGF